MLTNFLQGIGTNGVLQVGPNPRGATLFVNSTIGIDNRGRVTFPGASASTTQGSLQGPQVDPSKPLATFAYALTFCLAGRGDTIILQQGHVETLAASVTCSVDGVQIIGEGNPSIRPVFTMAGFSIILSGKGCRISNCVINAGTTANTVGVLQLTGNGCSADNCHILAQNVTTVGVLTGAINQSLTQNYIDGTVTGFDQGIKLGAFDNTVIQSNIITGIFATAPINFGGAATNVTIAANFIQQLSTSIKPVIAGIVTAVSGLVANNSLVSQTSDSDAHFFAGANVATNTLLVYLQNFGFTQKAGPSSGILVPSAGTIP